MKKQSLFSLKSIGLVLVAVIALVLCNYAEASTTESTVSVVTANMGLGAIRPDVFERGANFFNWLIGENTDKRDASGNIIKPRTRNDFDEQFVTDFLAGKKRIDGFSYYIRKKLGGKSGNQKIIESTDKNVEGITNMGEGFMGSKGVYFVATDLLLQYAAGADAAPDSLIYTNAIYDSTTQYVNGAVDTDAGATGNQFMPVAKQVIPTAMVNAELQILNGTEVIAPQILCSDLFVNNRSGIAVPGNNALALRVPKLFRGDAATTANLQFPKGAAAIAEDFAYVHFQLSGVRISDK